MTFSAQTSTLPGDTIPPFDVDKMDAQRRDTIPHFGVKQKDEQNGARKSAHKTARKIIEKNAGRRLSTQNLFRHFSAQRCGVGPHICAQGFGVRFRALACFFGPWALYVNEQLYARTMAARASAGLFCWKRPAY